MFYDGIVSSYQSTDVWPKSKRPVCCDWPISLCALCFNCLVFGFWGFWLLDGLEVSGFRFVIGLWGLFRPQTLGIGSSLG